MGKMPNVRKILEQKGYVQNKFDTDGFGHVVEEYFQDEEKGVESTLLIRVNRFVEMDNPPACGYIDHTKDYAEWVNKLADDDWMECIYLNQSGMLCQQVVVDEPFALNAITYLKMCGFIVKKKGKHGSTVYIVSLV